MPPKHDYDGPLDIAKLDLRDRRALTWAVPCVKSETRYGCGAPAYTPCLYDGESWHPYYTLPDGSHMVLVNHFPFHSARWHAASKINPLEALAIVSRDGGSFDPNDLTEEEAMRLLDEIRVRTS